MNGSPARAESRKPQAGENIGIIDRAWFLLDSQWHEPVWVLRPTSVLEEAAPVRLRWDFLLPSGRCFTDERYASLLETSKQLIASIRCHSLNTGLAQRATTVAGYFSYLRTLVQWMEQTGFARFDALDGAALLEFQHAVASRPGVGRTTLAPTTVQKYLYLFSHLYRRRNDIGDGLQFDPFPGGSPGEVAGMRDAEIGRWPHTPDSVAVALVQAAIELVTDSAGIILQARQVYARAMAAGHQRGYGDDACRNRATLALQQAAFEIPGREQSITTVDDLAGVIDMLYAACFVVISYLVGLRAGEILQLQAGCVQRHDSDAHDESITVIAGAIFKRQPEYRGRPHQWVAPPPALLAIAVLEALSAGHRQQTGRADLWLRRRRFSGATEWQAVCPGALAIVSTARMRRLLNRFAQWLGLPDHEGRPWRLSTHQGRKTFARFAALRDTSSLFALARHFGHRERIATDVGYSGWDYRLHQEIESEILEQSVLAWEHMLAAPGPGGRAGAEIMAKRPRFRGARLKENIKSYARLLADAGLTLGVCDWGFCVYREEYSACLGNASGPNPARREPSTCARCKNFVVSAQHLPYWVDQVDRHEALLNEPALPLQTLRIARARLDEARSVIQSVDTAANQEHGNGHSINR